MLDNYMKAVTVVMDESTDFDVRSPIKRLGSTRKLILFNNIRLQLNEQLRCLDARMESQVSLIQELQDFFRRRGEVELDYSKSLDKLAKSLQLRHKEQKQKREQWPMFSSYACWQQLITQTKALSKDHSSLSEIYTTHLVARLQTVIDDVQRIYRKCREIGYETHEEILRVLQELHTTMKTYHSYQSECKVAEGKLRIAENQRGKLQQTIPREKLERSKKYRIIEKEVLKRLNKFTDARLKSLKARNEYQLCLEASNTTIHKYFVEDLSDLIDCMDLGFHSVVSRALLMHVTADQGRCRAMLSSSDTLSHTIHAMDSRADKQKFLELHHGAFMIPKRLEFQGQLPEEPPIEPLLQKALHQEMEARLQHLECRVETLRTESEEIWKTLETAEINLLEILNTKDFDTTGYFGDAPIQGTARPEMMEMGTKMRTEKQEIEEFYITKIREYILGTSRIARLDSKAEMIRTELAKDTVLSRTYPKLNVPKRKRIGRMNMTGQPKLFGGSLEEYIEATKEDIPLIMRSCIRVINLFGLHHQGIFRVSGSQVEISNFREGFERGDDPLADTNDASDINSVAGVLKLYLRELREPLFPIIYFDHFVTLAQMESKQEVVQGIRKFLKNLPRPVVIVIKYLFAFLNHLSEFSDENMMDAYNLAICFGPTLMPAPDDKDQVQFQNQVNELIKSMIIYYDELFPSELGGTHYEKYISQENYIDIDVEDSPTDHGTEDVDSEVYPSEDECDTLEATAQFDFVARSSRELSLRKGVLITLRKQVSNDWWQGTVNGCDGLIPDKYICLKIKDEDRDRAVDQMKSYSSEELSAVQRRTSAGSGSSALEQHHNSGGSGGSGSSGGVGVGVGSGGGGGGGGGGSNSSGTVPPLNAMQALKLNSLPTSSAAVTVDSNTITPDEPPESSVPVDETDLSTAKYQQQNQQQQQQQQQLNRRSTKYSYHDEPHSFEKSMEFLEDFNAFQFEPSKKLMSHAAMMTTSCARSESSVPSTAGEPIYADIVKPVPRATKSFPCSTTTVAISNDCSSAGPPNVVHFRAMSDGGGGGGGDRNSLDSRLTAAATAAATTTATMTTTTTKDENAKNKYVAANFQKNREQWEKRAGIFLPAPVEEPPLKNPLAGSRLRILSRNRATPDLVMDLPLSTGETVAVLLKDSGDNTSPMQQQQVDTANETTTQIHSAGNDGSNGGNNNGCFDDMTTAERFAAPNQCTLRKNDRFVSSSTSSSATMTATTTTKCTPTTVDTESITQIECTDSGEHKQCGGADELSLHIDETDQTKMVRRDTLGSPIPVRNTQKFVSQFADLHLTGGCLVQLQQSQQRASNTISGNVVATTATITTSNAVATTTVPFDLAKAPINVQQHQNEFVVTHLSSFKSVAPQKIATLSIEQQQQQQHQQQQQ